MIRRDWYMQTEYIICIFNTIHFRTNGEIYAGVMQSVKIFCTGNNWIRSVSYTHLVHVNTKMFQDAGIEIPYDGWTWDEFRSIAKLLTTGEGDSKVYGFATSLAPSWLCLLYTSLFWKTMWKETVSATICQRHQRQIKRVRQTQLCGAALLYGLIRRMSS